MDLNGDYDQVETNKMVMFSLLFFIRKSERKLCMDYKVRH